MTIEELLMKEDDATLLNIYNELDSCIIPATSYAHEFCRKLNRMIDEGKLCVVAGKYRNVYLPTVSKLIYKEMARRYSMACYNQKTIVTNAYAGPTVRATPIERNYEDEDVRSCDWCGGDYDKSDLRSTDLGMLCDTCIDAIRSRGEDIAVFN